MAIFEGAGVAIITPFHEDGSVDYERFGEIIGADTESHGCYHRMRNDRRICDDDA